jgi:spermidine synthase
MSDPFRLDLLKRILDEEKAPSNEDLSPRAFGSLMDMWLKKSGSPKTVLYVMVIISIGFAGLSCRKDRIQFTIMTSGFFGMAFELSLLLLLQVIYGYVYLGMCLIITLFMIGSALGALTGKKNRMKPRRSLFATDLALVLIAMAGCAASWAGVGWRSHSLLLFMQFALIPVLIFAGAFVVGYQFSAAARIASGSESEIIGHLYLADLAGAACGTILTGLVLVPKIGIIGVLMTVAILKTLSLGLNIIMTRVV